MPNVDGPSRRLIISFTASISLRFFFFVKSPNGAVAGRTSHRFAVTIIYYCKGMQIGDNSS